MRNEQSTDEATASKIGLNFYFSFMCFFLIFKSIHFYLANQIYRALAPGLGDVGEGAPGMRGLAPRLDLTPALEEHYRWLGGTLYQAWELGTRFAKFNTKFEGFGTRFAGFGIRSEGIGTRSAGFPTSLLGLAPGLLGLAPGLLGSAPGVKGLTPDLSIRIYISSYLAPQ